MPNVFNAAYLIAHAAARRADAGMFTAVPPGWKRPSTLTKEQQKERKKKTKRAKAARKLNR